MTSADETATLLAAQAAATRARVEADVAELAEQLTPEQVKERALDAAEHSLKKVLSRGVLRLTRAPGFIAKSAREHPVACASLAAGMGVLVVWRLAQRRR